MSNKSKSRFNPIFDWTRLIIILLKQGMTFGRDLLLIIDRDYGKLII